MSIGSMIAWDDTVLPFQLDRSDVRGRVVRLGGVLEAVLAQHDYPPAVEALITEAALLTALVGQTIEANWKLSLQIRGDGPVGLIATDFFAPGNAGEPARLRAYAGIDGAALRDGGDPFAQIGAGHFAILIDRGPGTAPYQGITPLAGGSLTACAEAYFAQSEQLPTRFALAFGRSQTSRSVLGWRGGGVMLQQLPKAPPRRGGTTGPGTDRLTDALDLLSGDEHENWVRANVLLESAEEVELVGPAVQPPELLVRLFHQESPRVFAAQPVAFGCTCSADRVRRSLAGSSARDIARMTTAAGIVTADCQFCGAHYEIDPATLGRPQESDGERG